MRKVIYDLHIDYEALNLKDSAEIAEYAESYIGLPENGLVVGGHVGNKINITATFTNGNDYNLFKLMYDHQSNKYVTVARCIVADYIRLKTGNEILKSKLYLTFNQLDSFCFDDDLH